MSTLETNKEIVIAKRSNEVRCFKNQYTGFSGGTPYGLEDFDLWIKKRVEQETGHSTEPVLLGLVEDNVENCELPAYRGTVPKISQLPEKVESVYWGVEIFRIDNA